MDKLARMCGGYTKKSSGGSTVKPKIVHRKRGGKVMKAEGGTAQMRLDKKPRKHRQDGGGMILNAEQRARQRMIDEAVRMRKAADTAPSPYSAEDRAKMNALVNSTAGREKGGKVTKGTYVGGHDSKADLIADKQLIKRAVAMHDAQEHKGNHTDLSKLKKGGPVHKAAGGRLGFNPHKKKSGTNVNVIVAPHSGAAPGM